MDNTIAASKGVSRTYQYGARKPTNLTGDAYIIHKDQVNFWNRLVTIERDFLEHYRAVLHAADPALAAEEAGVTALKTCLDRDRSQDRTELRRRSIELAARRKALRDAHAPQLAKLEETRRQTIKAARRDSHLWWPHYQTILAEFDAARRKVFRQGGSLHAREFGDVIKFTVVFPKGLPVRDFIDGRAPTALLSGQINADPGASRQRSQHHASLLIAIDRVMVDERKGYRQLQFPILFDRPLPDDGVIRSITVRRDHIGTTPAWRAQFLLNLPPQAPLSDAPRGSACGVDLGWRMTDRGLRIACWAGSDGEKGEVLLPPRWIEKAKHLDSLRKRIASSSQAAATEVLTACREQPTAESEVAIMTALCGYEKRSTRILERLHAIYGIGDTLSTAVSRLKQWWNEARRDINEAAHLGKHLADARASIYQEAALGLARQYGTIVIEGLNLARIADLQERATSRAVRLAMKWAAISTFQHWVKHQAAKHGATLRVEPSMDTTQECAACGHINRQDTRNPILTCGRCGVMADQDENAATNLMRAAEV